MGMKIGLSGMLSPSECSVLDQRESKDNENTQKSGDREITVKVQV